MRSRRTFGSLVRFGVLGLFAIALPVAVNAQGDPSIGTWKLNVEKSKFSPGPPPKSNMVTIEAKGDQTHVTVKGVSATGSPTSSDYSYRFDGKDYPVTGSADYDTMSLTRKANVIEGVRKKDGKVVQNYKRVISPDGKTMTVTTSGTNAQGKFNNVAVYEKQ